MNGWRVVYEEGVTTAYSWIWKIAFLFQMNFDNENSIHVEELEYPIS